MVATKQQMHDLKLNKLNDLEHIKMQQTDMQLKLGIQICVCYRETRMPLVLYDPYVPEFGAEMKQERNSLTKLTTKVYTLFKFIPNIT